MSATTTTTTDAQMSFRRPSGGRTIKNAVATVYVVNLSPQAAVPVTVLLQSL